MRSAAAKAAAARRKAAKEAAAREAAESAAAREAAKADAAASADSGASDPGASDLDPSVPSPEMAEESNVSSPSGAVAPPPVPPLPPMSAEEAAAAFSRAVPEPGAAVVEESSAPVAELDPAPILPETDGSPSDGDRPSMSPVLDSDRSEVVDVSSNPATDAGNGGVAADERVDEEGSSSSAPVVAPSVGLFERMRRAVAARSKPQGTAQSTPDAPHTAAEPAVAAPEEGVATTSDVRAPSHDPSPWDNDEADTRSVTVDAVTDPTADATTTASVDAGSVLSVRGLTKTFGDTRAVDSLDLDVQGGSFYGIVGPNGAGKTTTLSMITGLLRPDAGSVTVNGIDVWADPAAAKRAIGVLPDRLRVFDRLTGAQLLYYAGTLRGLKGNVVRGRVEDLARAFGLEDAMGRLVSDYSAGMVKKVSLAAAMIHSPRLLILDEPFESVDPVSAAKVVQILRVYVDNGGTVVLSSHSMDFIQRVCDHVAIIVEGQVLDAGPVEDVRGHGSLEERFLELAGGRKAAEGMEWLHSFSV